MKNALKYIFPLFFLCSFCACRNAQKKINGQTILLNSDALFRGTDMGMSMEQVYSMEKNKPVHKDEGTALFYHYNLNETDSLTISYNFDEKGLYEILAMIYMDSDDRKPSDLYNDLKASFTKRYAHPKELPDNALSWIVKNETSNEIEITLQTEKLNNERTAVRISYYDFSY